MGFHEKYGKNLMIYSFLNDVRLSITDPKSVETILNSSKTIKKSTDYDFLKAWLGSGLLNSFGKKWHIRRKIITPAFHFNILEQFICVFNRQVDILIDKIRPFSGKDDIDIYNYSTLCALDIICEASMGTTINAQESPNSEYVQAVKELGFLFYLIN